MFGRAPQRDFAQRDQVALAEKVLRRTFGLLRQIHLAGPEPTHQFIGRDIHQDDFVRVVQHRIGHRLMHTYAGNGTHRAVEAFEVLHIKCRPDVDARLQQLLHVLPALGVARTFDIGVREFIDQQHRGLACQRGVQVEFLQRVTAVRHVTQRQLRQSREQFRGFDASVGFHHANQQVCPGPEVTLCGAEHGVGLADAGTGAEVDAQLPAPLTRLAVPDLLQKLVRVGTGIVVIAHALAPELDHRPWAQKPCRYWR